MKETEEQRTEEVPRDPWSGTDQATIAETAIPQLDAARQRTVRLVISIPVLTLLIVLGAGTFLYSYLVSYGEGSTISPELLADLDKPATRQSAIERLRFEAQSSQSRMETLGLTLLLISILISLGAAGVGYLLARQIVRPIRELTETMDALAQGDFSTKMAPLRLGEFGQLGSSFNRMVEQLNRLFDERDRQLRESFSGAHILLDVHGNVVHADASARRIFGERAESLMGRNLFSRNADIAILQRNPRLQLALSELTTQAVSGTPGGRTVLVRNPEGGSNRFLVSTIRLEGGSPDTDQVLLEIRDITGMAGFYEQIQRADRLAAVGTLATGIAHEIRNPLASIRGMVQLMAEFGGPDDANAEYHRRILREVDRLEKLIAGIMDFASKEDSPAEEIDLNALLHEVVENARHHVGDGARGIDVQWETDPSLPRATLQAERIRQALLNLLVNAFQHCAKTQQGPIRVQTIHLPVNQQRPIIICIANPSEALDEVQRERIFEPFYTTKPEGTGLGLPIAYQTVASNGGILELECENEEVQFWLRLPTESPRMKTASRILPRLGTDSGIRIETGADNTN
ncbi:HAMP domain-containing protein [bacterium]|nr:HAMP domain-containing protein [bacterium]